MESIGSASEKRRNESHQHLFPSITYSFFFPFFFGKSSITYSKPGNYNLDVNPQNPYDEISILD